VAAQSKASVCGRLLAGIAGSNPAGWHGCVFVVSVVCCEVEGCVTVWSLVQRSAAIVCVCVCVCVCVSLSVIRDNSNPLHLQRLGRNRSE
jgi:hypothetical protein